MYINGVRINSIRSIAKLNWDIPKEKMAGWHVIIGDNGSGKSTFLRSIALALVGPQEAIALRQDWNDWLRKDFADGSIFLGLFADKKLDKFIGKGLPLKTQIISGLLFKRENEEINLKGAQKVAEDTFKLKK